MLAIEGLTQKELISKFSHVQAQPKILQLYDHTSQGNCLFTETLIK